MTNTNIAKLMWDAYAIQAGGKTFDGKPLPTWDELGDERQSCWVAAASVTADRIQQLEAALRKIASESKIIAFPEDMQKALTVKLGSHRKIARKALEEKDG